MDAEAGKSISAPIDPYDKPHIPVGSRAGLRAAHIDKPLAKYAGDPTEILERLTKGESAYQIAESLGISNVNLYAWLIRHCPDEWAAISAGKSLARMEQAEADMDAADDKVKVSKARESHRMGTWTLERVAKNLYGDAKDTSGVVVNVVLDRSCGGTVSVEPIDVEPA